MWRLIMDTAEVFENGIMAVRSCPFPLGDNIHIFSEAFIWRTISRHRRLRAAVGCRHGPGPEK